MNATEQTNAPGPPPPPSPGAGPVRRLTRASDDKVLTGLCGGLGRHFGIDPVIFRVAFVVLSLAGGTGIVLYLAGWLLVPDDATGVTEADRLLRQKDRRSKAILTLIAIVGVFLVIDGFNDRVHGEVPLSLALIGIGGAVLWSRRNRSEPPPHVPTQPAPTTPDGPEQASAATDLTSPLPTTPEPEPGPGVSARLEDPLAWSSAAAPSTATVSHPRPTKPPKPAKVPKPPKPRSVLVFATFSLLAVLGGLLALLGVSLATSLALALVLTGGAMVVGAWRGRAKGLIPVVVLLGLGLAVASVADVPFHGGIGERFFTPHSTAELQPTYRWGIGHAVLDLRGVDFGPTTSRTVLVTNAIGRLEVIVPPAVTVEVHAHSGAGEIVALGDTWDGSHLDRTVVRAGTDGSGRLVLRARVGIGQVEVRRAAA